MSVLTINKFRDCKNTTERLDLPRGCRGGVGKMEKLVHNFVEAQMYGRGQAVETGNRSVENSVGVRAAGARRRNGLKKRH